MYVWVLSIRFEYIYIYIIRTKPSEINLKKKKKLWNLTLVKFNCEVYIKGTEPSEILRGFFPLLILLFQLNSLCLSGSIKASTQFQSIPFSGFLEDFIIRTINWRFFSFCHHPFIRIGISFLNLPPISLPHSFLYLIALSSTQKFLRFCITFIVFILSAAL